MDRVAVGEGAAGVRHGLRGDRRRKRRRKGSPSAVPRYEHIFLIIEENKSYTEIVGDQSVAPNINRLAKEYGLATQFYAEVHPSEANYIAMLGGDTFGIHDDDAYYCKPKSSDPFCPASGRAGLRGSHRGRAQLGGSARGPWTHVEGVHGKHSGTRLGRGSMADGAISRCRVFRRRFMPSSTTAS